MKPFIFQFRETAESADVDYSKISYDSNLNLNIDLSTGKPAIDILKMGTVTGTKVLSESSDSDPTSFQAMMGTELVTLVSNEVTESDKDRHNLHMLMATSTQTRVIQEQPDNDF
ncbi:hypothetical protein [Chitinophaga sp. LS1]|uniref:hypothetical protein n=1 Tax=Chitinophaga sp. LS1 TaxID=3051176 RepID=UPI002AAB330E|nr:hypothetical protein [Chitinophaga sp. LS1]WPV67045.1 hypothetical protein QQL36_35220 [Chitinophaga sp. LS1]